MTEATMRVRGRRIRYLDEDDPRAPIDRADQIPPFRNEADERAWWGEHRLSEEFWRTAERVPSSELPPVRELETSSPQAQGEDGSNGSLSVAFAAGVIFGGALVLGAIYLLLTSGSAGARSAQFVTTKSPNMRISA